MKWNTTRQVQIRIVWFQSLGLVTKIGEKYTLSNYLQKALSGNLDELPSHNTLRDMLYQIGKNRGYVTEREFVLKEVNNEKLDVLWKSRGQMLAWEVHLEGGIHQALGKLRYAFLYLPAGPRLVTTSEGKLDAEKLIENEFDELKGHLRIMLWDKIVSWYCSLPGILSAEDEAGIESGERFKYRNK